MAENQIKTSLYKEKEENIARHKKKKEEEEENGEWGSVTPGRLIGDPRMPHLRPV